MYFFIRIIAQVRKLYAGGFASVLLLAMAMNLVFAVGFYFAERGVQPELTIWDAVWWSMVTMTTVGYGDFYAHTPIGRFLVSYPCMLLGIGVIGYLVGFVANMVIEFASKKRKGLMDITLKNHIIICNYPSSEKVLTIVKELRACPTYKDCHFVLIDDRLEELPEKLAKQTVAFVKGPPTDEEILRRAGIFDSVGVIVLAEDPSDLRSDDRTYAITSVIELMEKDHGSPIKTVAELLVTKNARNFERAQVDGYVTEEDISGCLISQEFAHPGVSKVIAQLLSNSVGSQLYIQESQLVGHAIVDLQMAVLKHEADIQVIGLIQDGRQILNPSKKIKIGKGDRLIVLAENLHDLKKIEQEILSDSNLS